MRFKRSSGLLVHPTSFPGPYGIGDLGLCAYEFIDFLKKSHHTLWQILPIGPTSFGDSPYQSFSTFAGNTLIISPDLLVSEGYLSLTDIENIPNFDPRKTEYSIVSIYKNELYKKAYKSFKTSATNEQKTAYSTFCLENISWLEDYSLFMALKEYFIEQRKKQQNSNEYTLFKKNHKDMLNSTLLDDFYFGGVWSTWPTDLANRKPEILVKWKKALSEYMRYYKFLQYEMFREWKLVKTYANENDVKIIGDIPIFVSYDSADAWANPELFCLDCNGFPTEVAGVPPDYFSATGQLWGNPLYNWEVHKATEYKWWIERIRSTIKSVDIVRIDHFRGFDEYWAIPSEDKTAMNGCWQKGPGKDLFVAIEKELGDLPIIAEDLGIITESVRELRDALGFPGMKILQFAFSDEDKKMENTYLPHNLTHNAVIYSGTHDNDTTIGWYNTIDALDSDIVRRYVNIGGEDISWDFIRLAYSSVCDIAIVPIQDVMKLGSEGRMNTPGVAAGNWQWRYTKDMLKDEYAEGLLYLSDLFGR